MERATFGAGCFWGVEAAFRKLPGVLSTQVGYAGGQTANPTYADVCSKTTGHAEVVEVTFNPARVSYQQLLDTFWSVHNPTLRHRQSLDAGSQYRSVIFYHTSEQAQLARESLARLDQSGKYTQPVATQILPAPVFWRAEERHQQYREKQGRHT